MAGVGRRLRTKDALEQKALNIKNLTNWTWLKLRTSAHQKPSLKTQKSKPKNRT